ncbi:MAG: peptidylprolyl isomerase [Clostridia bacterium]|nr:peptidylprolyl isomerase [Clostridia bacterium]
MQKKALLALLMAAVMLLSGCSLIVTDVEKDNARIVLDVNGETMNKGSIAYVVDYTIEQNNYYNNLYYQMLGQSAGYSTDPATVLNTVLDQYTEVIVQNQKAQELGLDILTEEETAQVQVNAETEYESLLASIQSAYLTTSENTGDALREEVIEYAAANGYASMEDMVESLTEEKIREKLKADAVKDVAVTEEELAAELEVKASADLTAYTQTPSDFGYDVNNGTTAYYAPAGYRYVKQVLIKHDDAESQLISEKSTALSTAKAGLTAAQNALDNAEEGADTVQLQADLDAAQAVVDHAQKDYDDTRKAAYDKLLIRANKVYEQAMAGEDFDALIEAYNEDPGMQNEPGKTHGYAVCADFIYFEDAFVNAAMALENVGDVSAPTEGSYGYYIVRYEAEIPEGAASLEDVREPLTAELLAAKQEAHYADVLAQWISEADVKSYPEKMGY